MFGVRYSTRVNNLASDLVDLNFRLFGLRNSGQYKVAFDVTI